MKTHDRLRVHPSFAVQQSWTAAHVASGGLTTQEALSTGHGNPGRGCDPHIGLRLSCYGKVDGNQPIQEGSRWCQAH